MEVKKEIQRFRNQALMSRYDKAVQMGNNILLKLQQIQAKNCQKDSSQIQKQLIKQIDLCVQLSTFVTQNYQSENVLKNQPQKSNEQEVTEYKPKSKSTWNKIKKHSHKQTEHKVEIKSQKQIILQTNIHQNQSIEEKLYKHLILPLNMPLFKLKNSLHLIITKNSMNQVINYLTEYEFKQFETLQIEDLGVQNILNAKIQMIQLQHNRGFIVVQSSGTCQNSNIQSKIAEACKQIEKEDTKNKAVLVLLLQNNDHFSSPAQKLQENRHQKSQKSIFFY